MRLILMWLPPPGSNWQLSHSKCDAPPIVLEGNILAGDPGVEPGSGESESPVQAAIPIANGLNYVICPCPFSDSIVRNAILLSKTHETSKISFTNWLRRLGSNQRWGFRHSCLTGKRLLPTRLRRNMKWFARQDLNL